MNSLIRSLGRGAVAALMFRPLAGWRWPALLAFSLLAWEGRSEVLRTERIALQAGWNAVHLTIAPLETAPGNLFAGTPVEIVAAFFAAANPVYFPRDPREHPWQEESWGVWYAAERPESFASNLYAIEGQRPYLIFSSRAHTWEIRGRVGYRPIRWEPDAYNFAGLPIDPELAPAFAAFFAGSRAHRDLRIFQLVDGKWTLIKQPGQTQVQAGAAYWIYCRGASDYQGPIRIKLPAGDGLRFGAAASALHVKFANDTLEAREITIQTIQEGAPLPLAFEDKDRSQLLIRYHDLPPALALPRLEAGRSAGLRLVLRRERMTLRDHSALLRVSNGAGAQLWIPVTASQP